jgi:2-keto-4-pentenoate hydratase/2-oxohepta-3-ene-1,7-dioic acid hydratase in catechol pathway
MSTRLELANVGGRACIARAGRSIDIEQRSHGAFSHNLMDAITRWDELRAWARDIEPQDGDPALVPTQLGACVPRPSQVFAIGLNYRDHAKETGMQLPPSPMVFTKFPSCLAGPRASVPLTSVAVDWEIELVAVIGQRAHLLDEGSALDAVAGYCIGQDITDRQLQFSDTPPQFSLAKSSTSYGPVGPTLVSRLDGAGTPLDLASFELQCEINGVRMQHGFARDMLFSLPKILVHLSRYVTLKPGDLIFTGTPPGAGIGQKPPVFLKPGDVIRSTITGLGELENTCIEGLC